MFDIGISGCGTLFGKYLRQGIKSYLKNESYFEMSLESGINKYFLLVF